MAVFQVPSLYEPQLKFINAKSRYVGYGGARGGGKSFVARILIILLALKYNGIQILILRRTFPELRENHIIPLRRLLKSDDLDKSERIALWKSADKVFEFPNGSRVVMGYCDGEMDVLQFQGQSYDVIFMEEATQFTQFQFNCLTECNRPSGLVQGDIFSPRMYFTANPGGVGHQWFKRLFIDKQYQQSEKPEDYTMIRARVYDNEFIMENDPNYVRMLQNLPTERRKAMLDGDWDAFEGQFFPEFNRDIHVVKPFKPDSTYRIFRTRDYGLDMCATYWAACDYENNFYIYKELYEPNLIVSEAGRKINDMTDEKIYIDFAPPDLYNKNSQTGKSAVDIFYSSSGHILTKANNDRPNGWLAVKEMLALKKDSQGNFRPQLYICENCTNLIRTLPLLVFDPKKPEDCLKDPHEITHAPDALRYLCASWTSAPVRRQEIEEKAYTPLDNYARFKEENAEGDYYEGNF